MCKILGIKRLWTTPYHPQTNGLVERSCQMIMQMIRKLGEAKKADWLSHLAEIAHAYNATCFTVTGYSPHYLIFGWRFRLPVNIYFPSIGSNKAPMRPGLHQVCEWICSFSSRKIEDSPLGGASPIDGGTMPTKMVLWQIDRHSELETWWPGTREGRCF